MITLEPDILQRTYATRLVQHIKERSVLEVISGQLVVLLAMCCI